MMNRYCTYVIHEEIRKFEFPESFNTLASSLLTVCTDHAQKTSITAFQTTNCTTRTFSKIFSTTMAAAAANNRQQLVLTTLAFIALPLVYHQWYKKSNKSSSSTSNDDAKNPSLASMARRRSSIKPPFPPTIRKMLSACRLAYLSTVDMDVSSSHLSLMRFTYLCDEEDGEVVIMSTNMKTKKFSMLQKQRGVALLVHDFQQDGGDGVYSITLNGKCRIVEDNAKAEAYRAAHLKHNPDYPQFIVGEDIAILCVDVTSARICNIDDQVTKWEAGQNMTI